MSERTYTVTWYDVELEALTQALQQYAGGAWLYLATDLEKQGQGKVSDE